MHFPLPVGKALAYIFSSCCPGNSDGYWTTVSLHLSSLYRGCHVRGGRRSDDTSSDDLKCSSLILSHSLDSVNPVDLKEQLLRSAHAFIH